MRPGSFELSYSSPLGAGQESSINQNSFIEQCTPLSFSIISIPACSRSSYSPVNCPHVSHCRGPANARGGVQLATVHRGDDNRHGLAAVRRPLQLPKTLLTGSSFGYDSAFIGTTIARQSFVDAFNIVESEAADISSNITSTFQAGAFFGAIFCFLCELSSTTPV